MFPCERAIVEVPHVWSTANMEIRNTTCLQYYPISIYIYIPKSSSCAVFQPLWFLTQISAFLGSFSPFEIFLPLRFPGNCKSRMICAPTLWFRKIRSKHQQSVGLRTSPENKVWKLHSCTNPWQNNCFPRFQLSSLSVITFELLMILVFVTHVFCFFEYWLLMTCELLMLFFWILMSFWLLMIFCGYSWLFCCWGFFVVTHEILSVSFFGYSWLFSCSWFSGGYSWILSAMVSFFLVVAPDFF